MRILIFVFTLFALTAQAGTYPFYYYFTQHTQNQLLYNPAYAGSTDKLNLHVRSMHGLFKVTGTRGAINILNHSYIAFDRPCPAIRGAWGAYAIIDRPETGAARYYNMSVGGNYAYRWQINEDHRLQFGASVNFRRHYRDQTGLVFSDPNEPTLNGQFASNYLDFGLGAWYQVKDLNVGVSLTHFGNFYVGGRGSNTYGRYTPALNIYAAYQINFTDRVHFEPYLYLSTAGDYLGQAGWGENYQISIGGMADYNKTVFLGFGYSHAQVISPTAGFQLKKKVRIQGTYNLLLDQPDSYVRYHNFELSLTVQLPHKEKEREKKEKKKKQED